MTVASKTPTPTQQVLDSARRHEAVVHRLVSDLEAEVKRLRDLLDAHNLDWRP